MNVFLGGEVSKHKFIVMVDHCMTQQSNLSHAIDSRSVPTSTDVLSLQSSRMETESEEVESMMCHPEEHECTALDVTTSPNLCNDARKFLAACVLNNSTSAVVVNRLLEGLRKFIPSLAKDYRTLMRTPRTTNEIDVDPGTYGHMGITYGLKMAYRRKSVAASESIHLQLHVDEFSSINSSGVQV